LKQFFAWRLDGSDVIRLRFNDAAESAGKTWRKKIDRTVLPVGSLHRDGSGHTKHDRFAALNAG
jgi:hypothetical protein